MTDLKQNIFKYNMSFYYQSTISYFVMFMVYLIIRGSFVEDSYSLVTRDPIIYFFALILLVSLISLLFSLYKNRHLKVTEEGLQFIDRYGKKTLNAADIESIKLAKEPGRFRNIASRSIRIKLKNRRRLVLIRPNDYENVSDLMSRFRELKNSVEKGNV